MISLIYLIALLMKSFKNINFVIYQFKEKIKTKFIFKIDIIVYKYSYDHVLLCQTC